MAKVICTSNGFVKDVNYNNNLKKVEIIYTKKLYESISFVKNKSANSFMEKYNIKGFIFKPLEEIKSEEIFGNKKYFCGVSENNNIFYQVYEYKTQKYKDIDYFKETEKNNPEYISLMSYEDAKKKCKKLNENILKSAPEDLIIKMARKIKTKRIKNE